MNVVIGGTGLIGSKVVKRLTEQGHQALAFFESSGRNLARAERDASVGHHVALSVVGTDRCQESGYFRAKLAQEMAIQKAGIHDAHAFVYVLEGSVIMQVKGGKEVTLGPGQTFYEGPSDVHVVGRNASTTKPAKFVVLLLKKKGAPVLVPVK